MYLLFDTETTGLPRNWKAPITDSNNWPRLVQIAWLVYDIDGNRVATQEIYSSLISINIISDEVLFRTEIIQEMEENEENKILIFEVKYHMNE